MAGWEGWDQKLGKMGRASRGLLGPHWLCTLLIHLNRVISLLPELGIPCGEGGGGNCFSLCSFSFHSPPTYSNS